MERRIIAFAAAFFFGTVFSAAAQDFAPAAPRRIWAEPATNLLGSPSPDGRFLSFVDAATGDLALRDLKTGTSKRLTRKAERATPGEFAYFSVISPDGAQVAYAWFNEKGFYELRAVGVDGSAPRVLYRNEEVPFIQPSAWSPDGKQILTLFFRKDNISQIAWIPAEDGSVRVLKSLRWVYPKKMDVSPDGQHIVYDSFAKDGSAVRDIFLLASDGSREVRLVDHPADDLFPVWMPDGRHVLFASDRAGSLDAWVLAVEDGKPQGEARRIRQNLGRFLPLGVSRSGAYFYGVRTGPQEVYLAGLGAPAKPKLVSKRFPGGNSDPVWSRDGKLIAYLSQRGKENYGEAARIVVIHSVESGAERELAPKLAHIERLRWSPDGLSLLASGSDNKSRGGLYRVDLRTGKTAPVVLDENAGYRGVPGEWAADGKSIYYAGSAGRILRANLETGEESMIYETKTQPVELALRPDGRLALLSDSGKLSVVDAETGDVRELAIAGKGGSLAWSEDGKEIVLFTPGEMQRINADSGSAVKTPLRIQAQGGISLDPEGKRIAFTGGATRSEVWVIDSLLPTMESSLQ